MNLRAQIWYRQDRLEGARSEVLRAIDVHENLGAAKDLVDGRMLLQGTQKRLDSPVAPGKSGFNCKFLQFVLLSARINSPF